MWSEDGVQRRAQLMAHAREKFGLGTAGGFGRRLVARGGLEFAQIGHVGDVAEPGRRAVGLAARRGRAAHPALLAIGAPDREIGAPHGAVAHRRADAVGHALAVFRLDQPEQLCRIGHQRLGSQTEQGFATVADVGEAGPRAVGDQELVEHTGHVARDQLQAHVGARRPGLEFAQARDVGLRAQHAARAAVGRPVDDAAALVHPMPLAVGAARAVDVLVTFGLAARMALVGGLVGLEVVGVDQAVPVFLGRRQRARRVAQHRIALVEVSQLVAGRIPLPHEGACTAQGGAQRLGLGPRQRRAATARQAEQGGGGLAQGLEIGGAVAVGRGQAQHAQALGQVIQGQPPQAIGLPGRTRVLQAARQVGQRARHVGRRRLEPGQGAAIGLPRDRGQAPRLLQMLQHQHQRAQRVAAHRLVQQGAARQRDPVGRAPLAHRLAVSGRPRRAPQRSGGRACRNRGTCLRRCCPRR
jgi:hypothetical protein